VVGDPAAVMVTGVGRVENQEVLRLRIARLEVVIVEMLISAPLDAIKGRGKVSPVYSSIVANDSCNTPE